MTAPSAGLLPPGLLPALLLGAAVVSVGLPRPAQLRLRTLVPAPVRPQPPSRSAQVLRRPHLSAAVVLAGTVPLAGPAVALLLAAATVGLLRVRRQRERRAAAQRERAGALVACGALAAELRSGRTPAEALTAAAGLAAGPVREALRAGAAAAQWGGDVPAALGGGTGGSAVPEVLRGLAACWQVCGRAGGGLAAAVDRLADGLRARQAQRRAVAAALAGPRASAALLALLPAAGVALAAGIGAHPLHVLLHTPLGLACLSAGVGLDLTGLWWTGRVVARAER